MWHAFKGERRGFGAREADPALRAAREVRRQPRGDRPCRRASNRPTSCPTGCSGLIDALEKFEPGRGNKFETYAIPRIKGAIIDELRAMDWVPRSVRFKQREIEKALADLESMLKRQPTESELAERLGMSLTELHEVVTQISFVSVLALDETVNVGQDRGEKVSLDRHARRQGVRPQHAAWSRRRRGDSSPRRSTRCPSARRSS